MQLHETLYRRVVSFDELTIVSDNARRPHSSKSENVEFLPPLISSASKSNLRRPLSKQCRWDSNNQIGTHRLKMSHTVATITPRGAAPNHLVGSRAILARRTLLPAVVRDYSKPISHQNDEWQKMESVQPPKADRKKIFEHILSCPPRKPVRTSHYDAKDSSELLSKALSVLSTKEFGHSSIIEKTKCSPIGLKMSQRS